MLKHKYTFRGAIRWSFGTATGIRLLNRAIRRIKPKQHSPIANHLNSIPNISLVVSEKKKFVYLKVAKTAGSSILYGILMREVDDIITRRDTPIRYLRWLQTVTDEDLKDYFIFTIVRHPLERLVSAYLHLGIPNGIDFHDFLNLIEENQGGVKILAHTLPQHTYVENDGRRFVDFVGKYENLAHDWQTISKKIGVSNTLPRINVSKRPSDLRSPEQLFNRSTLKRAQKYYRHDFEILGYDDCIPPRPQPKPTT